MNAPADKPIRAFAVASVLVGCQSVSSTPQPASVPISRAAVDVGTSDVEAGGWTARTCPVDKPRPVSVNLGAVTLVAEAAGTQWLVANESEPHKADRVLLHVGASGSLETTGLPAWTEDVAVEQPHTLRFLVANPTPRWWTVDVSDPDKPMVGKVVAVSGLKPGPYPKGFASDGARALISMYRTAPAGSKARYVGETALYEVPSGKRTSAVAPMTVWTAQCRGGRCFGVGELNAHGSKLQVIRFDDHGAAAIHSVVHSDCAGVAQWRSG